MSVLEKKMAPAHNASGAVNNWSFGKVVGAVTLGVFAALVLFCGGLTCLSNSYYERDKADREAKEAAANTHREETAPKRPASVRREGLEVVGVSVVPWRTPSGANVSMAIVTLHNTGETPIPVANADIEGYDSAGRLVYSADDYTIFVATSSQPPIPPGGFYTKPSGTGHVLLPVDGSVATSAKMRISRFNYR